MKRRAVKPMFSLSAVRFHDSPIAGRGVFAARRFAPGDFVVAYAPKQRRVDARDAEAAAAALDKISLRSGDHVIVPDTRVPGGWLCNHSCDPNAALYSSGEGRIECTRHIAPGEEITIFYGWVSRNDPARDPCRCGAPGCRGFINFDLGDDDAAHVDVDDAGVVRVRDPLRSRLQEYGAFLRGIGQEQVEEAILAALAGMKAWG